MCGSLNFLQAEAIASPTRHCLLFPQPRHPTRIQDADRSARTEEGMWSYAGPLIPCYIDHQLTPSSTSTRGCSYS
jgi:hypothetical protein